ncbi:MAG: GNAT family N-acetyltransferase [Planctomycetota bacterium]
MSLTYYKRYRMEARPASFARRGGSLPDGYRFVAWSGSLVDDHAEAKHESFRGELDGRVFECLSRREGCRELMAKIASKDAFLPEVTWLIEYVAGPHKREPCGTIQGTRVTPRMGAIHNVGVTPLHRGRGLGAALVVMAMQGFLQAGVPKVYLEVTAENEAAVQMYKKLGFRRVRTLYKAVDLGDPVLQASGSSNRRASSV